ncbi:MAG: PfkB family carbohydrate kinase [Chloroflexota bacterium]
MRDIDIMMIGHFAKDRLVVDGKGHVASGGGVYYGGVALARLGLGVAVVTRLNQNDNHLLDELRDEGIQVFATAAPETSGIENLYDSADMERRICKTIGFAGKFSQDAISDLRAEVYMMTPIIAGEMDLEFLKALASHGPVGLDVQGFVRVRENGDLVFRRWQDMDEGLQYVKFLKVDRAEAELLTDRTDLEEAAQVLASYGHPDLEIIVTQSSGVMVLSQGKIYKAPFTPRSLAGRTGRGDTCFATYVGSRLNSSPEESCRLAAAITTLKQEKPGPWSGNMDELKALLAE